MWYSNDMTTYNGYKSAISIAEIFSLMKEEAKAERYTQANKFFSELNWAEQESLIAYYGNREEALDVMASPLDEILPEIRYLKNTANAFDVISQWIRSDVFHALHCPTI